MFLEALNEQQYPPGYLFYYDVLFACYVTLFYITKLFMLVLLVSTLFAICLRTPLLLHPIYYSFGFSGLEFHIMILFYLEYKNNYLNSRTLKGIHHLCSIIIMHLTLPPQLICLQILAIKNSIGIFRVL